MNTFIWIISALVVLTAVIVLIDSLRCMRLYGRSDTRESVHLAIVRHNSVLLVPSPTTRGMYRHPLSTTLHRRETKEQALRRLMSDALPTLTEEPKLLLKYQIDTTEHDPTPKQVVHLYVLNVEQQSDYERLIPGGRFFDCRTVDRLAEEHKVTAAFMDEFAYLRNTVILCNSLISNKNKGKVK